MTSADVSFDAESSGQRQATLNLRNLQVFHRANTNFSELIGLDSSSEGDSLVSIEYEKNPTHPSGPKSFDSLLTLKLCPLKIHAVMACVDELKSYVGQSLDSLKDKRNSAATSKTESEDKQTRDIIEIAIQSPTLLVANSPDSHEWHEISLTANDMGDTMRSGDLRVVKDGANLTVQMLPDAVTGKCGASVKTVGDFKGSAMELFQVQIDEVNFVLQKGKTEEPDRPLVHAEFNLSGQFWNLRHSCWEEMFTMKNMLLEVSEQTSPLLGWNVRVEPLRKDGGVHKATLKASGALVYSGIQYLKCKNSRRVQSDV
eukprot:COSAG02_NODE_11042_length_1806_cov_1.527241_2_plen_313_part_01